MKGFCPLASGSKGNSIYLGTERTRILIDAGLSASATIEKLGQLGIDYRTISAVLITHEHLDHIRGIAQIASKWKIPVLANAETAKGIIAALNIEPRWKIFTTGEPFSFEDLQITAFSVPHDTLDPVGFSIQAMGWKLGFCTDLGHATSLIRKMLERSNYLYLEANHEPSMVHACARPAIYKERVLGKQGHLSNADSKELLLSLIHPDLKHVHLAHLSGECNSEQLVLDTMGKAFRDKGVDVPLSIAYQDRISASIQW